MNLVSTNPSDRYSEVGSVPASSMREVAQKTEEARAAFSAWRRVGIKRRVDALHKVQLNFLERKNETTTLMAKETGKPIAQARDEFCRFVEEEFSWFLDNAERALEDEVVFRDEKSVHVVIREPRGVVASIAPWNFPLGMPLNGIIPPLLAGNTVVFKASEEAPLTGKVIEECFSSLPAGVFCEVYGGPDVGDVLVKQNIDMIWFTGSTRTGKSLHQLAAAKMIHSVMELGGSSPCVVFEDADIARTTETVFKGRFNNNGQTCSAIKRLIVHEDVAHDLVDGLSSMLEVQKIGDALNEENYFSSLVSKRQKKVYDSQFQDAIDKGAVISARLHTPDSSKGAYVTPAIMTNISSDMRVWNEEVFGPLLPVVTFSTEKEAVDLSNDTPYGLNARVISEDEVRCFRVASQIDVGTVAVNHEMRAIAADPFGGNKDSGFGRERGIIGLREFCKVKCLQKSLTN